MPDVENKPKNWVINRSPQGHFESQDSLPLSRCAALQKAVLLEKAAPKPLSTDPTPHQDKAAYQTPKYFQLPKKNHEKNAWRKEKLNFK